MVFGDHGRRADDNITIRDNRVPLMVRLAGQAEGVAVAGTVDLLKLHDLTLEILAGRVTTAEQVAAILGTM